MKTGRIIVKKIGTFIFRALRNAFYHDMAVHAEHVAAQSRPLR